MILKKVLLVLLLSITFTYQFIDARLTKQNVLSPNDAFTVELDHANNKLVLDFNIQAAYYLYQSKFNFTTNPQDIIKEITYSKSEVHHDDFFGQQNIFRNQAVIEISYQNLATQPFSLQVTLQGCADVGICYPPITKTFNINKMGLIVADEDNLKNHQVGFLEKLNSKNNRQLTKTLINDNSESIKFEQAQYNTVNNNPFELSWRNLMLNLLAFFFAGLAMSLTACMYPLIPIISAIIIRQQNPANHFLLAMIYIQGIAVSYTIFGIVAGFTGSLLNIYLQQAIFIIPSSIIILLLGLSMLGLFKLQIPQAWQTTINQLPLSHKNHYITVFLSGIFSALIIGPCIAPPLAFALGYIGSTQNFLLGGIALYTMAIGISIPLLIFVLVGDKLLPKSGNWMNSIQYLLAIGLLFIAAYLAAPFLPWLLKVSIYSLILFLAAVMLYFKTTPLSIKGKIANIAVSLLFAIAATWLFTSSIMGQQNFIHYWLSIDNSTENKTIQHTVKYTAVNQLIRDINHHLEKHPNEAVYLDFYADWCVTCKQMEKYTFSDKQVQSILKSDNFFQIDITENTLEHRELLKAFNIYAPPGFFVIKAPNKYSKPLMGFANATDLIQWIEENNQF